jgi:hypothetical protein
MMKSLKGMVSLFCVAMSGGVAASEANLVKEVQSPAKEVNYAIGNSVARKAFSFSGGDAWLDAEGSFQLKIAVSHQRIRCAEYQTAIQFGTGSQRCNAVNWIGSPVMLTNKKQCNSSQLVHTGGNWLEELSKQYAGISCARIQVYCEGKTCF